MLSNTCKYALRSIIYIGIQAAAGKRVNVRQIASELEVPMQFLSKILQVYVHKGILVSQRGPHGGFSFNRDPQEVTLFDIIVVIDGVDLFDQCVIGTRPCHCKESANKKCSVHNDYEGLRTQVETFFKNETIGGIAKKYALQEQLFLSL